MFYTGRSCNMQRQQRSTARRSRQVQQAPVRVLSRLPLRWRLHTRQQAKHRQKLTRQQQKLPASKKPAGWKRPKRRTPKPKGQFTVKSRSTCALAAITFCQAVAQSGNTSIIGFAQESPSGPKFCCAILVHNLCVAHQHADSCHC